MSLSKRSPLVLFRFGSCLNTTAQLVKVTKAFRRLRRIGERLSAIRFFFGSGGLDKGKKGAKALEVWVAGRAM